MTDINSPKKADVIQVGGTNIFGVQSRFSPNMYAAMVEAAQNKSGVYFGNTMKIQEGIWNKELLVECDIVKLDSLVSWIQDKFDFALNKYNSLPVDGTRQVGEYIGSFEYKDKGYIILFPRNSLTDETVPERGIYKGVIVNPELYFSDDMQRQREETSGKATDIL